MRKTDGIFQSQVKNSFLVTYLKQYGGIETFLLHKEEYRTLTFKNQGNRLICSRLYKVTA